MSGKNLCLLCKYLSKFWQIVFEFNINETYERFYLTVLIFNVFSKFIKLKQVIIIGYDIQEKIICKNVEITSLLNFLQSKKQTGTIGYFFSI